MTNPSRPSSPAARNRHRPPFRHRLHRATGVATGFILLYLIGTGLPLQLTDPLNLAGRFVESATVLDWYGIQSADEAYRSDDAVQIGNRLYWKAQPVTELNGFHGAIRYQDLAIVATDASLLVFPADAPTAPESIGLAERVRRIGLADGQVVLDTASGLRAMDPELLNSTPTVRPAEDVAWAPLTPLAGEALASYQQLARARILTLERLLLDLHSGRAFGAIGEWMVNLATLAMAVLAFTGLLIWWKTR
jgi:uncharacterized iron-regulated membrane protein